MLRIIDKDLTPKFYDYFEGLTKISTSKPIIKENLEKYETNLEAMIKARNELESLISVEDSKKNYSFIRRFVQETGEALEKVIDISPRNPYFP